MKIITAATLVAAIGLSACEYVPFTPENRIEAAKAKIAIHSANPTTIQWSDVKEFAGAVCGVFNAEERTAAYGTQNEWSGPQYFVTVKGEPTIVTNYSDCEAEVGAWSRCRNAGDEAKIKVDVEACRATQTEMNEQARKDVADSMRRTGLEPTGDTERDQATWNAYYEAARIGAMVGFGNDEDRVRWRAGDRFKAVYNAEMRKLPDNATQDQKVAAVPAAVSLATQQAEAILKEGGVV